MEKRTALLTPKYRVHISIFIALATLAVMVIISLAFRYVRTNLQRQELEYLSINTSNKIQKVITDLIWKSETLATLIVQGNGEIEDFEKISAILVNQQSILNVSLAPNGVVSKIFPLRGNESVIGLDYLDSGGSDEARKAVATDKLTLAGPFDMVQGGQTLTGRLPVYLGVGGERKFWGFVGIALAYPGVLQAAYLDELYQQGYAGQIWRIHPATNEKQVIWESEVALGEEVRTKPIHLFNVTWYISVSRITNPRAWLETIFYSAIILFVSLMAGLLSFHYFELRQMKTILEKMAMTDSLTGLPNRRCVVHTLETMLDKAKKEKKSLSLVYVDLNNFKNVNDLHGHEEGDRVLIMSSEIIRESLGDRGLVGRVGGDEFILLLPNAVPGAELDAIQEKIRSALQITVPASSPNQNDMVHVSASFGASTYPEDGEYLQSLLHEADIRMYMDKKKHHGNAEFKKHFR